MSDPLKSARKRGEKTCSHYVKQLNEELDGLGDVIKLLIDKKYTTWSIIIFLLSGNTILNGRTPLEVLKNGCQKEDVLRAARVFLEHGSI
jgi:hypothetical protein